MLTKIKQGTKKAVVKSEPLLKEVSDEATENAITWAVMSACVIVCFAVIRRLRGYLFREPRSRVQ